MCNLPSGGAGFRLQDHCSDMQLLREHTFHNGLNRLLVLSSNYCPKQGEERDSSESHRSQL